MYIYDAMGKVSPLLHAFAKKGTKAQPYPNKPYEIGQIRLLESADEEQAKENERLRAILFFKNWAKSTSKKFGN